MGLFGAKKVAAPKRKGPPPMSLDNCSQHIDNKVGDQSMSLLRKC